MKKKSAPKKVTKASKGLPPAPPTMQEEANTLTHEFLSYVGTMYKKELPWGTDHTLAPAYWGEMLKPNERVNTIGLSTGEWVRKQFDNFHASITMFRNRHEKNPELRNTLGELLQTVSSCAFQDSPVYQEDGSLNEEASEVRFGFDGGQVIKDWKDIGIDVAAWANERDTILLKERLRLTETIRELIDHLPPVDSKPDGFERIDHVKGPHCKLPDLSNAMHWMKAPTTEGKWLELQREGVACLYLVMDGFVHEQYKDREEILLMSRKRTDLWHNMLTERTTLLDAFAKSRGVKERGSALSYGETFNLAKHHLRHGIKVPHVLTKDEAAGLQQRPGTVDARFDHGHPDTATATAEQVGRRWADIFVKEAADLRGTNPAQTDALHRLSENLLAFEVGIKEGADVLARMKGEGKGSEVLAGFNRCKDYLLQRLDISPKSFEIEAAGQYAQLLRDELPGFSICPFPLLFSIGTRETYPDVKPGIMIPDSGARNVENWSGIDKAVRDTVAKRVPNGELKGRLEGWTYASIVPEGNPNPFDIPNPRQYLLDGSMIPSDSFMIKGRLSKVANDAFAAFRSRLKRAWASPMNLRKAKVEEYLNHHFTNGSNPTAFLDFLEVAINSKSSNGKTKWHNYEQPLQRELAAWVVSARKRLEGPVRLNEKSKTDTPPPKLRTLAERLDAVPGARKAFDTILKIDGFTNDAAQYVWKSNKGKGRILANLDAVIELYEVEGYGNADSELHKALCEYLPGLRIDKRPSRLRDDQPYRLALPVVKRFIKERKEAKG